MFYVGFECYESVGWVLKASLRFGYLKNNDWVWGSDLLTGNGSMDYK